MAVLSKVIIVLFLLLILYSLGSALYYLIKDQYNSTCIVKALTWRIGLSLVLFIFLMVMYWMGFIEPHGLGG